MEEKSYKHDESTINQNLIDVACGTGDISKLFLESVNYNSNITCVDPNKGMIAKGKEKLKIQKYKLGDFFCRKITN